MLAFSGFWILAPGFRRLQDGNARQGVFLWNKSPAHASLVLMISSLP